jgi:hypothetical protein
MTEELGKDQTMRCLQVIRLNFQSLELVWPEMERRGREDQR